MNILTLLVNSNPWIETIQLLPVLIELVFFVFIFYELYL